MQGIFIAPKGSQWRCVVHCGKGGACLGGDGHHHGTRGTGPWREAGHELLHRLLLEEDGFCGCDAAAAREAVVEADLDRFVGGGRLGLMKRGCAWLQAHLARLVMNMVVWIVRDVRTAGAASCVALPSKLSTHAWEGAMKSLRSASFMVPLKPMPPRLMKLRR